MQRIKRRIKLKKNIISKGNILNVADFILSSIAGLGHIMVGAGIIFFMLTLIKSAEN